MAALEDGQEEQVVKLLAGEPRLAVAQLECGGFLLDRAQDSQLAALVEAGLQPSVRDSFLQVCSSAVPG